MSKKWRFVVLFLFVFFLSGCVSDIEIKNAKEEKSDVTEKSEVIENSTSESENISAEINNSPKLNEKFYAYPFTKSGLLYVTVTGAEYYTNINDADIDINCFSGDIKSRQKREEIMAYSNETGEVLKDSFTGTSYVFVLAHITVENVNAVSSIVDFEPAYRQLNPMFSDGYCDEHDFYAHDFGIGIKKSNGASNVSNTTGNGVDYFSLAGQHYSDEYRYFLYHLDEGETVSFDIGNFLPTSIVYEKYIKSFGGSMNENLIPRYCLVTSFDASCPIVDLELE